MLNHISTLGQEVIAIVMVDGGGTTMLQIIVREGKEIRRQMIRARDLIHELQMQYGS